MTKIEGLDLNDLTQEELVETAEAMKNEFKELQSNGERGVQKLIQEGKALEKAISTYAETLGNPEQLEKIIADDPELGKVILEKFFGGKSIDDVKKNKWLNVDELVDQRLNQKEVERKLSSVQDQLPEELREKFNEEFKDLTEGKKLTSDNVGKYIKNTLSNIDTEESPLIAMAKATANSWSVPSKAGKPSNDAKSIEDGMAILRKTGVI